MPAPIPDVAALRREYTSAGLDEADLAATWHEQLARWLSDAVVAGLVEPNAVVLGTATPAGVPSARTVLLKGFDARGLVVFTNLTSRKGREAAVNPHVSLVVPWVPLERQVVVAGVVDPVSPEETADYFHSRPRSSQIGAWVSRQSIVLASRDDLVQRQRMLEQRFGDGSDGREVPVPEFWGGLRVVPSTVEFWQGRPSRLHDRLRFRAAGDGWVVERLSP